MLAKTTRTTTRVFGVVEEFLGAEDACVRACVFFSKRKKKRTVAIEIKRKKNERVGGGHPAKKKKKRKENTISLRFTTNDGDECFFTHSPRLAHLLRPFFWFFWEGREDDEIRCRCRCRCVDPSHTLPSETLLTGGSLFSFTFPQPSPSPSPSPSQSRPPPPPPKPYPSSGSR